MTFFDFEKKEEYLLRLNSDKSLCQYIHFTVMRFSDLKETLTDTTADSIFEKFR